MGKIILTGDIHAELIRIMNIPDDEMTKEDIVIVLGDFGGVWYDNKETIDKLRILGEKNFTLAFVDGNHENFNLIKKLEVVTHWKGGQVGLLPGGILHLLRGEIYDINNKVVGVCGGAESIDKFRRKEGTSWWPDEAIAQTDIDNFKFNLENNKYTKLDLMLSHDCPLSIVPLVRLYAGVKNGGNTQSQRFLEEINQMVKIDKWYFGHWHFDLPLDNKFECLYYNVKEA